VKSEADRIKALAADLSDCFLLNGGDYEQIARKLYAVGWRRDNDAWRKILAAAMNGKTTILTAGGEPVVEVKPVRKKKKAA
jgi:hypothetical protein